MEMRVAVEEQHRFLAHKSAQWAVGFSGVEIFRIAEKHLANRNRIAGENEG